MTYFATHLRNYSLKNESFIKLSYMEIFAMSYSYLLRSVSIALILKFQCF